MEIECINKCGNLTDSPNENECETCREITINELQSKFDDVAREDTQGLIKKDLLLDTEFSIEEMQAKHKEAMLKFNKNN